MLGPIDRGKEDDRSQLRFGAGGNERRQVEAADRRRPHVDDHDRELAAGLAAASLEPGDRLDDRVPQRGQDRTQRQHLGVIVTDDEHTHRVRRPSLWSTRSRTDGNEPVPGA